MRRKNRGPGDRNPVTVFEVGVGLRTEKMNTLEMGQALESCDGFTFIVIGPMVMLSVNYSLGLPLVLETLIRRQFLTHKGPKMLSIAGLFGDERDLWEVPECRDFAVKMAIAFPNFLKTRGLGKDTKRWLAMTEAASVGAITTEVQAPFRPTTEKDLASIDYDVAGLTPGIYRVNQEAIASIRPIVLDTLREVAGFTGY